MPPPSRAVRWAAAAAAALLAGGGAALAVAPIEPSLDLHVSPMGANPDFEFVELRISVRGGETIPEVRVEVAEGDVRFGGPQEFRDLAPERAASVNVRVRADAPTDPVLRVRQIGRVSRTYDVRVPVTR